jgi:hypothetical protein
MFFWLEALVDDSEGAVAVVVGIVIIEGFGELWPLVAVAFVIIIVVCVISVSST